MYKKKTSSGEWGFQLKEKISDSDDRLVETFFNFQIGKTLKTSEKELEQNLRICDIDE